MLLGASRMRKPLLAYVYILFAIACGLLVLFGRHIERGEWPSLLLLSGAVVLFDLKIARLPSGQRFSFSGALQLMAVLVAGLPTALWVAAIGNAAEGLIRGAQPVQVVYNVAQLVTVVFLSGSTYLLLGGQNGQPLQQPLAALAAGAVYLVANVGLIARLFAFIRQKPFRDVLREMVTLQDVLTYAIGLLLGIIGAFLILHGSWAWFAVVVALLLFLRLSFYNYIGLLESATLRGAELAAVLDAARSAIVVQSTDGFVRHVNRQFLQLAGIPEEPDRWIGVPYAELERRSGPLLAAARARVGPGGAPDQAILRVDLGAARFLDYYRGPIGAGTAGTIEVFTDITALKEAEEQVRSAHEAMLRALTAAIDARDPYTHGHSARVAEYAGLIARHLGLSETDIRRIHYSGLLHDIGKLGVDDRVLRKHGPLTPDERAAMMDHPVIGAQLLEKAGVFTELLPGVRYHHEWYNGGGYPEGLRGEAIPFDARVIGVADAFDAMTSHRPYRPALTAEEAVTRLQTGRCVQFDPVVVDAFLRAYLAGEVKVEHPAGEQAMPVQPPVPAEPDSPEAAGVIRPVHHKELSILYRVARENYARLELPQMLRRILEICYDSIGGHNYMVFLREDETGDLVLQASMGPAASLPATYRLRPGQGLVGRVADTGKPIRAGAVENSPVYVATLPGTRSVCAVPLVGSGEVIGVFNVESPLPDAFSRDDLYLFEALAQQVAGGVEMARYHQRLAHAATHDGLTGVLNHNAFYERLTVEVERGKRLGRFVSLIIMDLNGMKAVNDTYGHLAGDRALQEWAALLRAHVRESDSVARYGGDEFAVIMPDMPRRQALLVVERLARASVRLFSVGGRQIPLPQASFGVACFPEDGERATELVARADQQMYAEKGRSAPRRNASGTAAPRVL